MPVIPSPKTVLDVIIVGGGPAGLATALALSRVLHTAILFDSGLYRNRFSNHLHTVNTWDHKSPAEYRAVARAELSARYSTVKIQDCAVEKIQKLENGLFQATDDQDRKWTAKKVVLAVGSRDAYPDIPGFDSCWGTGIFHCLFCHGFEERGVSSAGVLAVGDFSNPMMASVIARQACQLASNVKIYTNGSSADGLSSLSAVESKSIKIESRKIVQLIKNPHKNGEIKVVFDDSEEETVGFLVNKPKTVLNGPFAEQLELELTPAGDIKVKQPFPETSMPGVFAAGDCATNMKMMSLALAAGVTTAAGVSMQLMQELRLQD